MRVTTHPRRFVATTQDGPNMREFELHATGQKDAVAQAQDLPGELLTVVNPLAPAEWETENNGDPSVGYARKRARMEKVGTEMTARDLAWRTGGMDFIARVIDEKGRLQLERPKQLRRRQAQARAKETR